MLLRPAPAPRSSLSPPQTHPIPRRVSCRPAARPRNPKCRSAARPRNPEFLLPPGEGAPKGRMRVTRVEIRIEIWPTPGIAALIRRLRRHLLPLGEGRRALPFDDAPFLPGSLLGRGPERLQGRVVTREFDP